jgi:hypothetical protein
MNLRYLKEIVSRDLHICFWYHLIDLKFLRLLEPYVCFLNLVFMSNFFIFASQRSELTLWVDLRFNPSPGLKDRIFCYWFCFGMCELLPYRGRQNDKTIVCSQFIYIFFFSSNFVHTATLYSAPQFSLSTTVYSDFILKIAYELHNK